MLTPWKPSTLWRPPRGALIGTIDWSPNGSRLVFDLSRPTRAGSTRLLGIYVLPAGGGRAHRIVRGGYLPVWSPSGRRIAYVDEHGLETVSTAGRHRRHLRRFKSWEALTSYPLSMSWQPRP